MEAAHKFSTMEAAHKFSAIYDRLNGQENLQELISAPILNELNTREDQMFYRQRVMPIQDLNIYNLQTIIDCCGWNFDEYPGSFAAYVLQVMTSAQR